MKIGDIVTWSKYNRNHLDIDLCAYGGMTGKVVAIYDDGSFCLDCNGRTLIVSMTNAGGYKKDGVWIIINGKEIFHKRIDTKLLKESKWKKFFNKLVII